MSEAERSRVSDMASSGNDGQLQTVLEDEAGASAKIQTISITCPSTEASLLSMPNLPIRPSSSENDMAGIQEHASSNVSELPSRMEDEDIEELARQLYVQEGHDKNDVAVILGKEYVPHRPRAQRIGQAYLKYFNFADRSFDDAFRSFLRVFHLKGETQQKMRILELFAERYFEQNAGEFSSSDSCFRMTVAVVMLNTDLYIHQSDYKMSFKDWSNMLSTANEGEPYPAELVKSLFQSIRQKPLELPDSLVEVVCKGFGFVNSSMEPSTLQGFLRSRRRRASTYSLGGKSLSSVSISSHRTSLRSWTSDMLSMRSGSIFSLPGLFALSTETLTAPLDGSTDITAEVVREGVLYRKQLMVREFKRAQNRSWVFVNIRLCGSTLFMMKAKKKDKDKKNERLMGQIIIRHGYCTAIDNPRRPFCFKLTTFEQASYLFQASSPQDRDDWTNAINLAAARFSAPPLPCGLSSDQRIFRTPMMPLSVTTKSLREQIAMWERKTDEARSELQEMGDMPSGSRASYWQAKRRFFLYQLERYQEYSKQLSTIVSSIFSGVSSSTLSLGENPDFIVGGSGYSSPIADGQHLAGVHEAAEERSSTPISLAARSPRKLLSPTAE